jgi:hypothetical protein
MKWCKVWADINTPSFEATSISWVKVNFMSNLIRSSGKDSIYSSISILNSILASWLGAAMYSNFSLRAESLTNFARSFSYFFLIGPSKSKNYSKMVSTLIGEGNGSFLSLP